MPALTSDGKFRGRTAQNGAVVFRGIVYARYTRFGLPEIVDYGGFGAGAGVLGGCTASDGVSGGCATAAEGDGSVGRIATDGGRVCYDATHYGCVCPQDLSHLNEQLGPDSGLEMREGELCLSVTVPPGGISGGAESLRTGNGFESSGSGAELSGSGAELSGSGLESSGSGLESSGNGSESSGNGSASSGNCAGLPVMVWIHGGSYLTGGSEDHRYDVSALAETGNVIVVKISYRLGASGYLWFPEKGVANLGLEDQKTALRWIRRHISSFGGDPDNVTLWGQSAGAHSVASLIASADGVEPLTNVPRFGGEVLFHRAILQSPPLGIKMTPRDAEKLRSLFLRRLAARMGERQDEAERSDASSGKSTGKGLGADEAERSDASSGKSTGKGLGADEAERSDASSGKSTGKGLGADEAELRWRMAETAPLENLIEVQTSMKKMHFALPFMPVLPDCTSFPKGSSPCRDSRSSGSEASGKGNLFPYSPASDSITPDPGEEAGPPFMVLLCCNRDDASVYARKILGQKLYRTPLGAVFTKILTQRIFASPLEKYLKKLRKNGIGAAMYRFNWHPEGSPLGCCHSIELPFLLGRPEDWTGAEMLRGMTEEEYQHYSKLFKTRWTDFARRGDFPADSLQ